MSERPPRNDRSPSSRSENVRDHRSTMTTGTRERDHQRDNTDRSRRRREESPGYDDDRIRRHRRGSESDRDAKRSRAERDDDRERGERERRDRTDYRSSRHRSRSPVDDDRRRRRLHHGSKHHHHRRDRSPSTSGSDSDSDSRSDLSHSDDSEEERQRRKRRERKRREHRKEDKEDRRARKERKREKKEKGRSKKHHRTAAVTSQWGTYGIISEADQHTKEGEFRAWLVEERHINPETIPKDKARKEFATFVEDYNTATLPHEKYYDMAKYEIKMKLVREGETLPLDDGYDPLADMKAHSSSLKRPTVETDTYLNRSQLEELRRVQQERTELARRKVLGLEHSKDLGVRKEETNKLYR